MLLALSAPMPRLPTLLVALAALASAPPSAAPRAQAPAPTVSSVTSISGRVIDGATGTPVSGAVVRVGGRGIYDTLDDVIVHITVLDRTLAELGVRTEVRTDRLGRFAFTDIPPGSYGVAARMDGWSIGRHGATPSEDRGQSLGVVAGQRAVVTIALWREPWIGGRVVNERGEPLAGAAVQVLRWQFSGGRRQLTSVRHLSTDDRGEYGGDVPPGEYLVRAQSDQTRVEAWTAPDVPMTGLAPVFYPSAAAADGAEPVRLTRAARLTVDFRLPAQPLRRLAGRLTNPTGAGAMPTSIMLVSQDGLETRLGASIDSQGRFLFERLFPGRYRLETSSSRNVAPGPVPLLWARALVDVPDADGLVTLPLRRGLILRGRLTFDGDNPPSAELLREFSVFLLAPPGDIGDVIPPHVQVQADGTFAAELPGGEYFARVSSGFNFDRYFEPGGSRPPDDDMKALAAWRVRSVVANGLDIVDAPLVLATDVSDVVATLSRDQLAARGQVRGRLNRPQDYTAVLIPSEPSLWPHSRGRRFVSAPVAADGRFTVTLPPGDYLAGAVRGLPADWRDGDLIAELAVRMSPVHLGADGSAARLDAPALEMPAGFARGALLTTPDAGIDRLVADAIQRVPLPASAGAMVAGRVVSAEDGRPLADVRVSAYPSVRNDVFTDAAGRFILQRVSPGSRPFQAAKPGWIEASGGRTGMVLVVNGDRVDDIVIRMARAGEIVGTVHDEDGEPVRGLGVRVWTYQPGRDMAERTHRSADGSASTDERGRYRIAGLSPGRYLVSTVPYISREQAEIPGTTEYDLDRAAGRTGPRAERRQPPPRGFPAVFNDGTADSASAAPIELAAGATRSVNLTVRSVPLATVNITLRSPDGSGLSNVSARLEVADRIVRSFSQLWAYPERREAGTLVFRNMLPGRYAFGARTATVGGVDFSTFADVFVTDAEQQSLTLDLLPGATVSGRITVDGAAPAPGAGLSIRAFDVSNRMDFAIAEAGAAVADDGTFGLSNVMPGRYRLSLSRQGRTFENVVVSQSADGRETLHQGLEVSAAQQLANIHLSVASRGADVTGVVRDRSGPSPATTVVIFPAAREAWHPRSPHVLSVRTDRQGAYVLKNVPPGEYRIAAGALPPDVWLDADVLSTLLERSQSVRVDSSRPVQADLAIP